MIPSEEEEQKTLVKYLEVKGWKFSALPLSTWTTSWKQKSRNKATGVRAGVPDLMVVVPCWDGKTRLVFIEMKRTKGGTVSENQKEWLSELVKCEEIDAKVCRGCKEAIEYLESFL